MRLADRHSLAGYWKLNSSLLDIQDFHDRLKSLVQWALVGRLPGISGGDLSNIDLEISPSNTAVSST